MYIIRVSSLKGGVGKTTVAVNLAVTLQLNGNRTLLVDCDTTNPSVGFFLGMEKSNVGLASLLQFDSKLEDIVAVHSPTGLHVINGQISADPYLADPDMIKKMLNEIRQQNYEFVIIDTMPGYNSIGAWTSISEALLITLPDTPSFSSTLRAAKDFNKTGIKHNLVVNRVRNNKYEIQKEEISEVYENKIIGTLPEDDIVPKSVSEKIPAVLLSPNSKFSTAIQRIAHSYSIRSQYPPVFTSIAQIIKAIIAFLKGPKN